MIQAAKNYLLTALDPLGLARVYLDVSEAAGHRKLPWAAILTPSSGSAEDYVASNRLLRQEFRDETYGGDSPTPEQLAARDTYLRIRERFRRRLSLDVTLAARDQATAEGLYLQFLVGLAKQIIIDPSQPDGYALDRSVGLGELHYLATIEPQGAVWSDNVAQIKDEARVEARLVFTGSVVVAEIVPAINAVLLEPHYNDEEAPSA